MKRLLLTFFFLVLMAVPVRTFAQEAVLQMPKALKAVEEEAFCGDTMLYEVVLPEGLKRIGEKAFA